MGQGNKLSILLVDIFLHFFQLLLILESFLLLPILLQLEQLPPLCSPFSNPSLYFYYCPSFHTIPYPATTTASCPNPPLSKPLLCKTKQHLFNIPGCISWINLVSPSYNRDPPQVLACQEGKDSPGGKRGASWLQKHGQV